MGIEVILFIGIMAVVIVFLIVLSFKRPDLSLEKVDSSDVETENVSSVVDPSADPQSEMQSTSETERLLAETEKHVRTIKYCVIFFIALTSVVVMFGLVAYLRLANII